MDISKEIERLENELISLKVNQQNISSRLTLMNDEMGRLIPTLTRLSQSLTEEESDVLRRLTQFQVELNLLKENCKEGLDPFTENTQQNETPSAEFETQIPEIETVPQQAACQVEDKDPIIVEPVEDETKNSEPLESGKENEKPEIIETPSPNQVPPTPPTSKKEDFFPSVDWEKFIGENLISKLGILILLIGVAIGGKYAIEHEMLSPSVRIIICTVFGLAMQGVAIKLKKDYKKFSAILSSGSSAILYFMTYFAYGFYDLLPKPVAFGLMVLITAFSVFTAWWYDMEIVAIIGQVGAYVIPFLLSDGSGSVLTLLTYIALIDGGILAVSVKKYWQKLFAIAFVSSWLIMICSYKITEWESLSDCYYVLALAFAYFAIFYVAVLAYKVMKGFEFIRFDVVALLFNSFIFFALGYNLIYNHEEMMISLPVFSLVNALIHCCVAFLLYKKQLVDKALQRLILALGFVFITVTIAIATSGHWITIFWMLEALALFWVGRSKKKAFYENMSYPIFLIAAISLMADWGNPDGANFRPLAALASLFSEWRGMWDVHPRSEQGVILPWITTVISLLSTVALVWIDNRYPAEKKDGSDTLKTKIFNGSFLFVLTLSIFVHFSHLWITILISLEFAIVFFFARKKQNLFMEYGSYALIAIATIACFGLVAAEMSELIIFDYLDDERMDELSGLIVGYYQQVIPSVMVYLLGLISVVNFDRIMSSVSSDWQKSFSTIIRVLMVYMIAFACFTMCKPYLDMPCNNLVALLMLEIVAFFFIGRYFKNDLYEKSILPLCFVLLNLWLGCLVVGIEPVSVVEGSDSAPWWPTILTSLFVIASLVGILIINEKYEVTYSKTLSAVLRCFISVLVAVLVIRVIFAFDRDPVIYSIDFALVYFALVSYFASKKEFKMLAKFDFILLSMSICVFAAMGLLQLSILRDALPQISLGYYLFVRYLSFVMVAMAIAVFVYYRNSSYCNFGLKRNEKIVYYDTVLVVFGLMIGTSELFNIFDLLQYNDSYKLALSIFWGCCSMFLIYFGLFKQMKHLRIDGFILFAVIIVKLFFYDLKHLDTLSKTIVFVSLGILLLVSSFFYQKIAKKQQTELGQAESSSLDSQEVENK